MTDAGNVWPIYTIAKCKISLTMTHTANMHCLKQHIHIIKRYEKLLHNVGI